MVRLDINCRKKKILYKNTYIWGFPSGASGKEFCQCRRCKRFMFSASVRNISWRMKWQPKCLGNPMDIGAWWATVCGVTKSQTQLSD